MTHVSTVPESLVGTEVTPADRVKFRSGKLLRRITVHSAQLLVIAFVILLWQVSSSSLVPPEAVSRPGPVVEKFWTLLTNGQLALATGDTMLAVIYAVAISAPLGTLLAVTATNRILGWFLEPIMTVAFAVPKVGLISLYIVILGVNTQSHVALVVSAIMFVYYYAVRQGLAELDKATLNSLQLMGAGRVKVFWSLVLPSATPHLLGATRVALPLAFASEIFAELRVPTRGLGVLLGNFTYSTSAAQSVAVAIFICAIAYIVDIVIGRRLRRYSRQTGLGGEL
jgi:ABC-type nitrate/sulfonate/bicarbonate transport system permease component